MRILEKIKQEFPEHNWSLPVMQVNKFIEITTIQPEKEGNKITGIMFKNKRNGEFITAQKYDEAFGDLECDYYVVKTKVGEKIVCVFSIEKETDGIQDGIVGFWYTENLLAVRKRADGLIGLEAIDVNADTRLSTSDRIMNNLMFPENVPDSNKEDADFGSGGKSFRCYKLDW